MMMRYLKYFTALLVTLALVLCMPIETIAATSYDCTSGNHRYTVVIERWPTETQAGVRRYTCELCGYSYTSAIPATGHAWGAWKIQKEATCVEEGVEYRVCGNFAEHRETRTIPLAEHQYEMVEIKPTCTAPGKKVYTCRVCGDAYTETTPAHGHAWGEWIVDKEPTKKEEGHRYRVCRHNAEHIQEESIPMIEVTITAVDIELATAGFLLIWLFTALIWGDVAVLLWYKREMKKQLDAITKGQD